MNMIRTITIIRAGGFQTAVKRWVGNKVNDAMGALFAWALSKPAVQEAVVAAFTSRHTSMCRAMMSAARAAVESELGSIEVNADDVSGLDRYIEAAFEQLNVSDINDFDEAVEKVVNGMETKDIVDNVVEEMIDRLRSR